MENIIEIIITIFIIAAALFLFVRSMKKKSCGQCDCGHCSESCSKPNIRNKHFKSK
ncbi:MULTISPECIES: FeoB-associated Cys-rich membrane protein [Clostridium]|uniref:FeoB-associated Cys-rich membrane protein n=1 Tax=Clostridium TaxID=1485 RepID=UPI0002884AC5|nr:MULTISPECIES: FeoB-associated Cys-rich membrane protein [Clostridium]